MASPHTFRLLILLSLLVPLPPSTANFSELTIALRTEKTTRLHFYFQDRPGGKNPTAVKIIGEGKSIGFGTTFMIDDALTEKLDRSSKIVGRAQGMYSIVTQNDMAFLMVVTFAFTEGKYNGSGISMLGRNHVMDDVREMPIVGGSGLFRLARGYALAHTLWFDPITGRDGSRKLSKGGHQ
ncbi:hypothetical protein ACS0TY_020496 [Phlomoides rotata]